jgi:hypothetical protein
MKNRLRSTNVDDWFVPLAILACERDVTLSLKLDKIVDRLAVQSAALKKLIALWPGSRYNFNFHLQTVLSCRI